MHSSRRSYNAAIVRTLHPCSPFLKADAQIIGPAALHSQSSTLPQHRYQTSYSPNWERIRRIIYKSLVVLGYAILKPNVYQSDGAAQHRGTGGCQIHKPTLRSASTGSA